MLLGRGIYTLCMSGRVEMINRLYYEYDREGHVFVLYRCEDDGDKAIDVLNDIGELYKKYPSAVSKEFFDFIDEMKSTQDNPL